MISPITFICAGGRPARHTYFVVSWAYFDFIVVLRWLPTELRSAKTYFQLAGARSGAHAMKHILVTSLAKRVRIGNNYTPVHAVRSLGVFALRNETSSMNGDVLHCPRKRPVAT